MERSWRLREGASFGELAALGVDPTYEATVIATEQCELYLLTQASNVVQCTVMQVQSELYLLAQANLNSTQINI